MKIWHGIGLVLRGMRVASPSKAALVIYDREGSDRLIYTALDGLRHEILPARREVFYFSGAILWKMAKNLRHLKGVRFGNFFTIYLLSCIQHMEPKVVITYIDNDVFFHAVSRLYPKARFIAVQNGVKTPENMASPSQHPDGWLPEPPRIGSQISMPALYCWGDHEKEIYSRYGHQVDEMHPVGSLVGGYYKAGISEGSDRMEYDLCVVSQWRPDIMSGAAYPYLKKGKETLYSFAARYVKARKLRCAVATCSNNPAETGYFMRFFGDTAEILPFNRQRFSTYVAMDRSNVTLALSSAAAYEAVGWGKKVFFCNFTGKPSRSCPRPGFWSLDEEDYAAFEKRLDQLLAMDQKEFEKKSGKDMRYLMNFDPERPAHRVIREDVLEALGLGETKQHESDAQRSISV